MSPLRRLASLLAPVLALALLLSAAAPAAAGPPEVDLALVLAVDISNSMDPEEQELQREGFIQAFRSPVVHAAIRSGLLGRIAVTYMEWAGSTNQQVVMPWTVIDGPEPALAFAATLSRSPTRRAPRTSISGAIDFSMSLLEQSGVDPVRRVIDISGDGANNQGRLVTDARNEAVARGVTINGLPIMLKRPGGYWDVANLDLYYRDCVIGGPGAFMVPVRERAQFVAAIRTKIIREIAGLDPDPRIEPAQASSGCLAGEIGNWERN
jgi:hypothetical protein